MKKILALALLMASSIAFAEGSHPQQQRPSTVSSTAITHSSAVSGAQGGDQQQQQGIQQAGNSNVTVGCLVNCAAPEASRDLTDLAIANINAEAAKAIADKNGVTARAVAGTSIKNTPSVNGPPLVSSNDTCMGSASGAINAPGIGIALGKTYTDENCMMLKNSRELWNMGMKAASLALMCNDSANREALELTGFECPQTTKAKREAQAKNGPADGPVQLRMSESLASPPVEYAGNDPIVRARLGLK